MDFIAIDFEIANEDLHSACSIGLAYVENNVITNEVHYLIKPPEPFFHPRYTAIHGITEKDVSEAMDFPRIWELIKDDITTNTIIAHNAQFDMSVLHCCLSKFNLVIPDFTYICSIPISNRATWGLKVGQSLKDRAAHFGIDLGIHHHAGSDARVCAEIVLASIQSRKKASFSEFCTSYRTLPINRFSSLKPQTTFGMTKRRYQPAKKTKKQFPTVSISAIKPTTEQFNEDHPFYEKNIVFTGDLQTLERKEAMQQVVNVGGILKSGVSSKTNFLIVGKQDTQLVGNTGISSKEKKAAELQEKGMDIKVLHEEEFLQLLTNRQDSCNPSK